MRLRCDIDAGVSYKPLRHAVRRCRRLQLTTDHRQRQWKKRYDDTPAASSVAALWRYPVKSMQGEQIDAAAITARGIVGDRAYAIVDLETGFVASAKHPRKWSALFACRAAFVEEPQPGAAAADFDHAAGWRCGP